MRKVAGIGLAVALMLPRRNRCRVAGRCCGQDGLQGGEGVGRFQAAVARPHEDEEGQEHADHDRQGHQVFGAVKSGKIKFVSPKSKTGANCTTLATPDPKSKGTVGKFTITWNNNKKSVVGQVRDQAAGEEPDAGDHQGQDHQGLVQGQEGHREGQLHAAERSLHRGTPAEEGHLQEHRKVRHQVALTRERRHEVSFSGRPHRRTRGGASPRGADVVRQDPTAVGSGVT